MPESQIASRPDGAIGEGLDEYLFYIMTQVMNRGSRDFAPALEAIGLSLPEWRALCVINRLDGCLMSELADFTTVDRTTLTRTVDQLVARNVLARNALPQDRRQVRVTLTAQGHRCFGHAVSAVKAYNQQALDGLSEKDLQTLRSLLQRILMNIIEDPDQFQRLLTYDR